MLIRPANTKTSHATLYCSCRKHTHPPNDKTTTALKKQALRQKTCSFFETPPENKIFIIGTAPLRFLPRWILTTGRNPMLLCEPRATVCTSHVNLQSRPHDMPYAAVTLLAGRCIGPSLKSPAPCHHTAELLRAPCWCCPCQRMSALSSSRDVNSKVLYLTACSLGVLVLVFSKALLCYCVILRRNVCVSALFGCRLHRITGRINCRHDNMVFKKMSVLQYCAP